MNTVPVTELMISINVMMLTKAKNFMPHPEVIKHSIRVGPEILAEPDGPYEIRECAEGKKRHHQKIPHHQSYPG
jgi:hypothetical protein